MLTFWSVFNDAAFARFSLEFGDLVGDRPSQATISSVVILERDNQTGIDLKLAKNYLKVDGQSEDDVITMLLNSAQKAVEETNGISLDGRVLEVRINHDGVFVPEILPYFGQITKVISAVCQWPASIVTYEIEGNKDDRYVSEVYGLTLAMYNEKDKSRRGKKIHI